MSVKPGQLLGQYRIIEQIGKGGMATVYRASQPSLSRQVAIKVLPDFFADDASLLVRFRQEATAIAALRHPNILTVFDSGESEGIPYIVTELIDGGTLASRLGKPLSIDYCLEVSKAIASALDYAHSRGMIHRDVKPSNILLTPDGTPILADFGLARMVGSNSVPGVRLTMSGAALGTPEYMAPEQVINKDVTPAVDIYALAVILYEMLTGSIPYSADTQLAILMSRATDPLPLPRDRNSQISEAVQEVLIKGLAKEPSDRYSKASELVRALEAASRTAAATTIVEAVLTLPTKVVVSRRKPILLATVVVPVVAVAVAIVLGLRQPARAPRPTSEGNTVATAPAPAPPPTETPSTSQPTVAASEPPGKNVPALTPAASKKDLLIAATTAEGKPDRASARGSTRLPPHGRLLYSIRPNPSEIAVAAQRQAADKIEVKGDSVEFTAATEQGFGVPLPVSGIGDFVAVMRFVTLAGRPSLRLRFHGPSGSGGGHGVRIPAYLRLAPPTTGAPSMGPHTCCQDFDMYTFPVLKDSPSIFTGPQPMSVLAPPNEEREIVISAKGPLITVYADGQEVGRTEEHSFGPGTMNLQVQAPFAGQRPSVLRLDALEIYDGSTAVPVAVQVPRGKLLYSIQTDLSDIAATKQQNPANTIAVKGNSLEFTLNQSTGPFFANLPVNGIGDFVAVMQIRAISRKPTLNLQFHKPSPTPGAHVVQLPAFLRLSPPASGARPVGAHSCCQDFEIYTVPIKPDVPMIFTGPQPITAPAIGSEPLEYVISVKGPLIVVYAAGYEIARASDSSFGAGGMVLQVQARGPQQDLLPAVLQLDKFEIYESR